MIHISAEVNNGSGNHEVKLTTNDNTHSITIAPTSSGLGSSTNGGELLFLALATCYCNDIYREAVKRNISVYRVQVEVNGDFDSIPGAPAYNITCNAVVEANASEDEILDLMRHTDTVSEVQNTLRRVNTVKLESVKAVSK